MGVLKILECALVLHLRSRKVTGRITWRQPFINGEKGAKREWRWNSGEVWLLVMWDVTRPSHQESFSPA